MRKLPADGGCRRRWARTSRSPSGPRTRWCSPGAAASCSPSPRTSRWTGAPSDCPRSGPRPGRRRAGRGPPSRPCAPADPDGPTHSTPPRTPHGRPSGKDLSTGRPTWIEVTSGELAEGIAEPVARIADAVSGVLDRLPPDIVPDLLADGVALTGGGALLAGLDRRLRRETGLPVKL